MSGAAKYYDVVVIGAGAAGLMCAFTAARRGHSVLVLEKANKIGKKILMSGGGRCNFSNYFVEADNFISGNEHFCKSALSRYTQWDFIAMVEQHGIAFEERSHSQLFCLKSAKDILNMLLDECEQAGVEIKTHTEIDAVRAIAQQKLHKNDSPGDESSRYQLTLLEEDNKRALQCRSLVVASGGLSIPTLGGSGIGYELAKQFELTQTARRAGLVPFMFSDSLKPVCERLSGLALPVKISCNGHEFVENMLFTHRGISGPAVLQISSYWNPGDAITIDLLPDTEVEQWLLEAKQSSGKMLLKNLLQYKLAKPLVAELQALWWAQMGTTAMAECSDQMLRRTAQQLSSWVLKPSATEGYRTAEVTLGGVDTDEISSKTMETKKHPGLFFVGEVLDVSGHLGGFNFQWAWSSGYSAGLYV